MTAKAPQAMPNGYPHILRTPRGCTLGNLARDRVTGFEGHLTGLTESLSGCTQYAITPQAEAGKPYPDCIWLDWQRLEILGPGLAAIHETVHTARADGCEPPPSGRQA